MTLKALISSLDESLDLTGDRLGAVGWRGMTRTRAGGILLICRVRENV